MRRYLLPLLLAACVPLALVVGLLLGSHPGILPGPLEDLVTPNDDAHVYQDVLDRIGDDFYRKTDKRKLSDAALTAAVKSLDDPFSRYIGPSEYSEFEASTQGNFGGIGVNVEETPRGLRILETFPDGPAAKAGLKQGDLIVAVDGKSLKGRADDATTEIKGPSGTSVRLTVVSGGKQRVETLQRARVVVPVSRKRMETHDGAKIGYVSLSQFTAGAHGVVGQNVRQLIDDGAKGIVFDLRHNGGGLLQEGVLVASVFIPDGLIVYTKGRNRPRRTFDASGDAIDPDIPVAVLVDGGTASASEIVTGALQDRKRATVVGQQTFGKGVFQEIEDLPNHGALDITVGEYFTPKGRNLGPHDGKRGLTPDVPVKDDPETKPDEVLQKGLDVVASQL